MVQRAFRTFLPMVLAALGGTLLCGAQQAHPGKTITIRVFDGKTGESIKPSNIEVNLGRKESSRSEWVTQNSDGSATVVVPQGIAEIMVRATYDNSTDYYINCDAAKERNTSEGHWYSVSEILTPGVVMADECVKPKVANRVKVQPKPGEFDLFVRKRNWHEQE